MHRASLTTLLLSFSILGCASDRPGAESLTWRDNAPRPSSPAGSPATGDAPAGEVIRVPEALVKELMGFVNRPQFLIADRIEVDASRIPFQAAMVPVADPAYVQTLEMAAVKANAVGFLIRSLSPRPMVDRDMPRLRVGDGTDLVAVREIAVRTWNAVDDARPVFIAIRGTGHAIYRDETSGRELRKDSIALVAEAVPGGSGLSLRTSVE